MPQKLNIGIVGAEEWNEEQQRKVRIEIENAFNTHAEKKVAKDALADLVHSNLTLVSAHDAVGKMAEEIADELGIKKRIFRAEVDQWEDKLMNTNSRIPQLNIFGKRGYESTYLLTAEACDVLYCFVPKREVPFIHGDSFKGAGWFCDHCVEKGHPTNNGCFALKKAKQLGKETHLILIE